MAETKDCELVEVMGRRWDTSRPNFFAAPEGVSLESIVLQSLEKAYRDHVYTKAQYRSLLAYARCRVNGREIDRKFWKEFFPQKGDRIEVLHGVRGGGGGGGKNPLAAILSVLVVIVATIATWWAGGLGGQIALMGMTVQMSTFATTMIGLVAAGALMAINMLFPAKPPSVGGLDYGTPEKESPTYSLTGGKNAHNINGYVPLVLGRHKVTPPLGAKSWTVWEGDDQYFNMLVVWGHPDMTVTDFKIEDTPLDRFADVDHRFHQSTTGKDLKYFAKQYNESSVGAVLKCADGWVERTVGEAEDLSVDITFPGGLTVIDQKNGNKKTRAVDFEIQYKASDSDTWLGFPTRVQRWFGETEVWFSHDSVKDSISVFWKDGGIVGVPRGETVGGGIQLFPTPHITGYNSGSGMAYISGCNLTISMAPFKDYRGYWYVSDYGLRESDGIFLSLSTGSFKYNGRVYYVDYRRTAWMTPPFSIWLNQSGQVVKNSGVTQIWPSRGKGLSGGGVTWYASSFTVTNNSTYNPYFGYYDGGSRDPGVQEGYGRSDYDYGYYYNPHPNHFVAKVRSGTAWFSGSGTATVTGAKQKQIVKNFRVTGLERKSYDVRIKRNTGDTNDSYIIDEAQWSTMRAIINQSAFDTPVPICVSELRIKASEQLSGYVSEFNAICYANIPDWDESQNKWAVKNTSNPASAARYLLTSKHSLIKPFAESRLDNAAFVALWKWCDKNGFRFDYVCDAEENLWARLVEVLSPAMASPTTDVDGLWGAVFDSPDKTVRQLFTPRNSWNMSIQRGFAKLPDALRVSFVDEEDDWSTKEGFVYNDGFSKDGKDGKKANDVVEWNFPGVTNWKRMYKLARYHLAQLLHRQMTVTINTDWEWLAVHRGDLVGLASDVLMNTFGAARVERLVYRIEPKMIDDLGDTVIVVTDDELIDNNGIYVYVSRTQDIPLNPNGTEKNPVGLELDDEVVFSEPAPARYGVAARSKNGTVKIYEVQAKHGEQHGTLWFANEVKAANRPDFGDLLSVSLLGEEYEEYLVASIAPGDNLSAQLTLLPYKTKEIMSAANGPIPEYEAPVILDVVKSKQLSPPTITQVRSDESVLLLSDSGSLVLRMGVWWRIPPTSMERGYTIQLHAENRDTHNVLRATAGPDDEYVAVSGVKVGETYYCKLRFSNSADGRTSAWSNVVTHTIVGLVAPPPVPQNVVAKADNPYGIRLTWDPVEVLDLHHYRISGDATGVTKTRDPEYLVQPMNRLGLQTYHVWSVDVLGNESGRSGDATFTIIAPSVVITFARLENDGIVAKYKEIQGTWNFAKVLCECDGKTGEGNANQCTIPYPPKFQRGHTVRGRGYDIFNNWGEWSDPLAVTIVLPQTPKVEISVDEKGSAVFRWQDCRADFENSPTIRHYILEGATEGSTTHTYISVRVEKIIWTEYKKNGIKYRKGALTEYVTAVDKYGFESKRGGSTFEIWPPQNPDIKVTAGSDGLYLEWQDCKTTFDISEYRVTDSYLAKTYKTKLCKMQISPRKAGRYEFSVQAVDCIGTESTAMTLPYDVLGVGQIKPKAVIDGRDVLVSWAAPVSSFPVRTYKIYDTQDRQIAEVDGLQFRTAGLPAGNYSFGVRGIDTAKNQSLLYRTPLTVLLPLEPKVSVRVDGDGVYLDWQEGKRTSANRDKLFPVEHWDVIRQWDEERSDGVVETKEQDYGRLSGDSLRIPAVIAGTHTFLVRAIDSAGNVGPWGEKNLLVRRPGKVSFMNCLTIDNNVLLYWTAPDYVQFPIKEYLVEYVEQYDGEEYSAKVASVDAMFASVFEQESGEYVYGVTPVDVAGNAGVRSVIKMKVAQPPDFVLYCDKDSLFNGTRTRFVLDGRGNMIGPYTDKTWQQNIDAIAAAHNVSSANLTWQQKKDWGGEFWMDPQETDASYVEIVDVTGDPDVLVPSCKVMLTVTSTVLRKTPAGAWTYKLESSPDRTNWDLVSNGTSGFASGFRYIRFTMTYTGGAVAINNINLRLDAKRSSDGGRVAVGANDNGSGWTSMAATPMLTGKWVPFNVSFVDVQSLPKPNVIVDSPEKKDYSAFTVFVDVHNPEGFRIFVLDKNGNRVSAEVDWSAIGIVGFAGQE